MARETFIDTSGFYSLLVKRDDRHETARALLLEAKKRRKRFVTSDYVLDETATLLKVRGHAYLLRNFFASVLPSTACRVEWTDAARFGETVSRFLKYLDHDWSFTDCVSFQVMSELRIRDALTKDAHFEEAGFSALLGG